MRCLLLLCLLASARGARILAMFPTPSISHQVVYRPLMLELARRGHELTVVTTDAVSPDEAPANYTQIDVHDMSYTFWREKVLTQVDGDGDSWKFFEVCVQGISDICELQLRSPALQEILHSGREFDLVFSEAFTQPAFALSHYFKTPLILFNSMGFPYPLENILGASSHVFLYPGLLQKRLYNLSLYEKLSVLYNEFRYRRTIDRRQAVNDKLVKSIFGPTTPTVDELVNNVDMLFINVNAMWDDNRPVPPSVVYTGALHMKPPKDLPTDLKSYLDNSKHGVIYMSFGTNVDPTLLSPERIQVFCNVFSKLPFDILWKWNVDELPGKPDNVRISKWLPQADLLRHPKIKLFITQGGLQSTDEAIAAGVPLVTFPMLGDQWYNAEKHEHFGIGKQMQFQTITEESLKQAIETVIGDGKYKESMARLRALMRDQPRESLERAVWWTEYVLRHRGARHLRSPQANLSWCEYLALDVALVLVAGSVLALSVLGFVLFTILNWFRRHATKLKAA